MRKATKEEQSGRKITAILYDFSGNWRQNIFYKSAYQQPEIPEIRGDCAEHLYYGCEQDHVLQVPKTRTHTQTIKTQKKNFVLFSEAVGLVSEDGRHNEFRGS